MTIQGSYCHALSVISEQKANFELTHKKELDSAPDHYFEQK